MNVPRYGVHPLPRAVAAAEAMKSFMVTKMSIKLEFAEEQSRRALNIPNLERYNMQLLGIVWITTQLLGASGMMMSNEDITERIKSILPYSTIRNLRDMAETKKDSLIVTANAEWVTYTILCMAYMNTPPVMLSAIKARAQPMIAETMASLLDEMEEKNANREDQSEDDDDGE
jgi:hypothetical protein